MIKKLVFGTGVVLLLLSYQNCSLSSTHSGVDLTSLSKGCQGILREAFRKTYYKTFIRSSDSNHNCLPCHDSGGEAGPGRSFATSNLDSSFNTFMSLTRVRVEGNAVNSGHKPPHTGPQNQGYIDSAKATWAAAEAAAAACNGNPEIVTSDKAAPSTVYSTTPADNRTWPLLSWDLDTDMAGSAMKNKIHLTISMEVRRFMDTTVSPAKAIGYQFRNPTVTVKAGGDGTVPTYRIQGIEMNLNGLPLVTMTAYSLLDVTVNSTTGANLAPGMAIALAVPDSLSVAATDSFALHFDNILNANGQPVTDTGEGSGDGTGGGTTTVPSRVSFNDLLSSNPVTGVFSRSCVSCHSATVRSGNLDLTSYAAANAASSLIKSRMNNQSNPMPPGGLASFQDRSVVDAWIASGTPQN